MRTLNSLTWLLIIVGGLNWLAVGVAHSDLVAILLGGGSGLPARLVYILVGLAALYQCLLLIMSFSAGEVRAQRGTR